MKNISFNNVRIAWNERRYPNILEDRLFVYQLIFPDNSIYIGMTERYGYEALSDICRKYRYMKNPLDKKIAEYRTFVIDVLYYAENRQDAIDYKEFAINHYLNELAYKLQTKRHKLDPKVINGKLLNNIWF